MSPQTKMTTAERWETMTQGKPWEPFVVGGRTFRLDDLSTDEAILWDISDPEYRVEVGSFVVSVTKEVVPEIIQTIESYLEKLRG